MKENQMPEKESYSQENLFSIPKEQFTIHLPADLAAILPEYMEKCGYKNESQAFTGLLFYHLTFFTEPWLSVQVMKDEPFLKQKCYEEAVERFKRMKDMSPEQRRAAEGYGNALSKVIEKFNELKIPKSDDSSDPTN